MQSGLDRFGTQWKRLELVMLLLLLALALWPVWGNAYFLTGDGPCHLYNARILRDMLFNDDRGFYNQWYDLNSSLQPNWLNHFLLTIFQLVLPPVLSEKLFLTLYIVGFALGFRYLAKSIFPENSALVLIAMAFVFHKVFLLGFFNFSASVVLFFFVVGYWLRHRHKTNWRVQMGFGGLMLLLLLTHPVSYCMALGLMGLHWLGELVAVLVGSDRKVGFMLQMRLALNAILAALPSGALLLLFLMRQGTDSVPSQQKFHTLYHDFLELKSLVLFQDAEKAMPIILSLLIALMVLIGLFRMGKRPRLHEGILAMLALSVYAYFVQPAEVGGVGIVSDRLQFFPYLIALCWLATLPWPRWLLRSAVVWGFAVTATLFAVRLPSFAVTSEAVEEFVSVQPHLRAHTTVVTLNYAPEGRYPNDGPVLSKKAYIFMHLTEYLGAMQPHIILNNYEANTQWFPLRWEADRDPYVHLADGPGFEGWLPTADFEKFRKETRQDVDYVLTWCLTEELRQFEGVQLMQCRLEQDYDEVFVSEGKRVSLWERKPAHPIGNSR